MWLEGKGKRRVWEWCEWRDGEGHVAEAGAGWEFGVGGEVNPSQVRRSGAKEYGFLLRSWRVSWLVWWCSSHGD